MPARKKSNLSRKTRDAGRKSRAKPPVDKSQWTPQTQGQELPEFTTKVSAKTLFAKQASFFSFSCGLSIISFQNGDAQAPTLGLSQTFAHDRGSTLAESQEGQTGSEPRTQVRVRPNDNDDRRQLFNFAQRGGVRCQDFRTFEPQQMHIRKAFERKSAKIYTFCYSS